MLFQADDPDGDGHLGREDLIGYADRLAEWLTEPGDTRRRAAASHPHGDDVRGLIRPAVLGNVRLALNAASADPMIETLCR